MTCSSHEILPVGVHRLTNNKNMYSLHRQIKRNTQRKINEKFDFKLFLVPLFAFIENTIKCENNNNNAQPPHVEPQC